MTKGVYLFKIEAMDIEEEFEILGNHTWEDVRYKFFQWLLGKCGASFEEVSYEEG